jgi:hypothetical protein
MIAQPNFILAISEQRVIPASALRNRPTIKNLSTRMIRIDDSCVNALACGIIRLPQKERCIPGRLFDVKNMID